MTFRRTLFFVGMLAALHVLALDGRTAHAGDDAAWVDEVEVWKVQ